MERLLVLATFGLLANVAAADSVVMQENIQRILNNQSAAIDRIVGAKLDALVEQAVLYRRPKAENSPRFVSDRRAIADRQSLHLEASFDIALLAAR